MTNQLYYGDNLKVLRDQVADASVDLIYLDPPFNSNASYNVLFKSPAGRGSDASIRTFKDTWTWGPTSESALIDVIQSGNSALVALLNAMEKFIGKNAMMAYIAMMAVRLVELHRVLKSSGSFYLHCDPVASHYLKLTLDAVFGPRCFKSEVIWRRTGSHKARRWSPIHDTIFFYTKSETNYTWNKPKRPYMLGHVRDNLIEQPDGTYRTNYYGNVLTGSGVRNGESGQPWMGFDPTAKRRHWAIPGEIWDDAEIDPEGLTQHEKLDLLYHEGFIKITPGQARPVYERIVTRNGGQAVPDIWAYQPYTQGTLFGTGAGVDADVRWLPTKDSERLGYETQKPVALLERIIAASSNPGDVVLDPFCGCGTAVDAAQKLGRHWIGIDVTHLSVGLIEKRMHEGYDDPATGYVLPFQVIGVPADGASALPSPPRNPTSSRTGSASRSGAIRSTAGARGRTRGSTAISTSSPTTASRRCPASSRSRPERTSASR